MIRYLRQEEKSKTRSLYEACFPEDSQSFVDYYYKEKIKDNQILVMEEAGSLAHLQVMIHLNPYRFCVGGTEETVHYIVAVATDQSVRRQGKMAKVLEKALADMAKEHQPFAFLIPANPKVYLSSGFVFVPTEDYSEWVKNLKDGHVTHGNARYEHDGQKEEYGSLRAASLEAELLSADRRADAFQEGCQADASAMAAFANGFLGRKYDIFPMRDRSYYCRSMKEVESQNGGYLLQKQGDQITGIVSYGKEEHLEIQELLAESSVSERLQERLAAYFGRQCMQIADMDYMVRILDLGRLVEILRFSAPFCLKVQIKDPLISANNGNFAIQIGKEGGRMETISPKETDTKMDIAELARMLFGKQRIWIREWV